MHGIDEKRVREWKKQRTGLEKLPTKKKCLDVRLLILWIDEMRAENLTKREAK